MGSFYLSKAFVSLQERTEEFKKKTGRRPRILLTGMGEKIDAQGTKLFALVYSDVGFDVDISPGGMTAEVVAKMAADNDVHVVGISGSNSDQRFLLSTLIRALEDKEADDIKIMVDHDHLMEQKKGRSEDFEILAARSAKNTLDLMGA